MQRSRKNTIQSAVTMLVIVVCVFVSVYGVWMGRDFVSGFVETKNVYVFPQNVQSTGWEHADAIKTLDHAEIDGKSAFSETTAAHIVLAETPIRDDSQSDVVTEPDDEVADPEVAPEQTEAPEGEASPETAPEPVAEPATEVVPEPAPESAPVSLGASFMSYVTREHAQIVRAFEDTLVSPVSATTTDGGTDIAEPVSDLEPVENVELAESVTPTTDDVALCATLGRPCYTIEGSGFGVDGPLLEKKFEHAQVAFSFASLVRTDTTADDKLLVRYYDDGSWKQAGEIYLNTEISNATNGGYFTAVLPDVTAWEDLADVHVVIEYARENSSAAELYLDALWVTASYSERAQDVLNGTADEAVHTPEHVATELTERPGDMVQLDDGTVLQYRFSDGDTDQLELRTTTDRTRVRRGAGAPEYVHVSVTNMSQAEETFSFAAAFPNGEGRVVSLEQYVRNIPVETTRTVLQDVTYFCESTWEQVDGQYQCADGTRVECTSVSETGENCLVRDVPVTVPGETEYESAWVETPVTSATSSASALTDIAVGYSVTAVSEVGKTILPGQTVYFRFVLETNDARDVRYALYTFGSAYGDLESELIEKPRIERESERSAKKARTNNRISERTQFEGDELPEFTFKFKSRRGALERFADTVLRRNEFSARASQVRGPRGKEDAAPLAVSYDADGTWSLKMLSHPRAFRPGKYAIDLELRDGGRTYTETVEFYWGVLAVNTDQSVYEPGDVAQLSIGAIDDLGNTICDAVLELAITTPGGVRTVEPVTASEECGPNNVISVPDYASTYAVSEQGRYTIELTEFDSVGAVLHQITDAFVVQEELAFVVTRTGPTRIYPKAPYTMELVIEAREDFSGTVRDSVPLGTILTETGGADVRQFGGALHLEWPVTLSAGQSTTLTYTFDTPDISPYLYLFGPARLSEGAQVRFEELRSWKVASDALGGYTEKMSSWSPTATAAWETKDLSGSPFNVPANAVLEIGILNNDSGNERLGGVRHASSSLNRRFQLQEPEPQGVTMATMHVQASATSSIQTYAETTGNISFVLMGYWSDGYYFERFDQIDPNITAATWGFMTLRTFGVGHRTIAEMVIGNWDTATQLLGGVRQASSSVNRYTDIHESEANGVNTVTMLVTASTTGGTIEAYAQTEGANNASIDYWLAGYWSVNPTGLEYNERFDDLSGPASASTWTDRALDSFTVPPTGIADVIFANAADANLSQLLGVRANGSALERTFNMHEAEAGGWVIGRAHVTAGSDASSTIEYFTDDTANDQFRLLGYWAADDYPAAVPTLYNEPFDNQKMGSSTPTFRFSSTDPDGTSSIVYEIEWDDDAALDASPLGSYASDSDAGFVDVTSGDTSPFTEGDQIRFTIPSALVSGTTYYWRVRAVDVNGSNIPSEWTDVQSFTYVANTDPAQWYQTQDTQFEAGTLSGVETDGSNAVLLSNTPPSGALIVYGVSTDTTPRYRVWSGTAWGSPASAQNVGGTAQWVVTKAGTTRNEYVAATQDALADVNVQVYDADLGTWGDLQEVTAGVSDITARGVDVAYETTSGDALVVFCDGDADPGYYVWNGATWTGPTSINLGSANNCEYIKLASNPASDEIVLVARDTGTQYEAQVWDGSAWSNSVVLGSMNQVAHEGIAVEYEESGNQAMVAVSNGTNGNFAWAAWDSDTDLWSTPTTQTIGNDFEAGMIARDDGTDRLVLCYADEDDDLGSLIWDGDGWATFVAGTNEFEATGTTNTRGGAGTVEGRPVSCQFETTTGRDGNALMVYSDNTAGRYRTWTGSSHVAEASVSSVQDSWTVASIRTGAGVILSLFHDDINSRYDFSSWDGSAWTVLQTLENSPSVTVAPFNEAYGMAAQVYQANSGTITSDPIVFTLVPSQLTWGEVLWNTTEPTGTDVEVQVLYETGGTCTTLIPDIDLPGNSSGFQLSASPLNISSLSTSTYDGLCLRATLTSTNTSLPTLNEWTLSWEREPYLAQSHYRWYVNVNGATPTDPWGTPDIAEDTAISGSGEPSYGNELRLRMSLAVSNVTLSASSLSLRLQYAADTSCDADSAWLDIGAIGSTTAAWRGFNNGAVSDGSTLVSALLTGSDVLATYEEENDSALNPSSATAGQELEWDWVLEHNGAAGTTYCFRTITADGEVLNAYDRYPTLTTNDRPNVPSLEKPFDNEAVASTTPWFEFVADDNEGDDVTYQVQVDDAYDFSSTLIDRDSQTNFDEFSNIVTTADKDPFTSGQTVRFIPTTALTNNTTYYWRVRAKDRNNSNSWSDWSDITSVTASTSVPYSMWHQTRYDQFLANTHDDTEATSTHDVVLTPPQLTGTSTGATIDFDWKSSGNAWGELSWSDNEATGDIRYRLEYYTGTTWLPIPNVDLPGNGAGFGSGPVSLLALSPTTYNQIRPTAHLTNIGGTPRLLDWTVSWDLAVSEPTLIDLFDNEKTGTTTPTFTFYSTDPESNDLRYEISWSQTTDFAASTTRQSGIHTGFTNTASSTDLSPFLDGDTISFKVQAGDALTNGTTYWWRVRARDPAGGDSWSTWSESRSFTVDTAVTVSTWFQTTDEQFDIDTLTDTETYGSDAVRISTIIREAFTAYAEGTTQVPRFKIWNGTAWGTEGSGVTTGNVIRFVEAAPAPTRDEYAVATINASADADVQIYNGTTDTFGNIAEIDDTISDILSHGIDIAYESDSGDLVAVSCDGTEAVYRVWNGTSWSATSSISLVITGNCEWIRLASDPSTDEIVMVVRNDITGGVDYQALVWNGSSWGNSVFFGSQATANDEGMAVEYEESGAEAVVVVANGTNASFLYDRWNGSSWVGSTTVAIGNDLGGAQFARDDGTDRLALCYVDIDSDIGFVEWSGSGWNGFQEFEAQANTVNGFNARPVSCQFETEGSRDGYLMMPFSDDIDVQYSEWTGIGAPTVPVTISTITDSWEVRTTRTGDGNVLGLFYDDATTDYDFSYWNGTQWSTEEILESTSIATLTPSPVPFDIVSRLYPSFTSGTVVGDTIDFDDGSGPKWESVSWTDSTPGSSNILYQVEYYSTTTDTWSLISNTEIPDNSTGTTTAPIDIGNLSRIIYNQIRVVANLSCVLGICPTLSDWTVAWSEGITVSGTAKAYDQSTNLTSGTVAVAVNGTLQSGKTGTIAAGVWTIPNVTIFEGDIVTVFIEGAGEMGKSVAITEYDGTGDITGMVIAERHITLGSGDNPALTNTDLGQYDNSVSGDTDLFFDVDAGNDLDGCVTTTCEDVELVILAGATYRPDSASSGNVLVHDIEINGTLTADANTITLNGSWDNNATFTANTSSIVFSATSTTETIDSTGASTASFNNVTFGTGSGTATWNLSSAFDVNGNTTLSFGTLSMNGGNALTLAGNLTIGASGLFTKGSATTTFDGTGSSAWSDSSSPKQDMGKVAIDGSVKTITLSSSVRATDITVGSDDTLNANGANTIEVYGDWRNNNVFTALTGTVSFIATTTGRVITPGSSSFYNLTFNGVGGNWSFTSATVTVGNNLTISTGTVSLATGTTTVAGNFTNSGGAFMHNNGIVDFTGSTAKTIQHNTSSFYDMNFSGSGSWSFTETAATSSRHVTLTGGTATMPTATFAIGGSFRRNGGAFSATSGTLKFIASSAETLRFGSTAVTNLMFDGVLGSWSFVDAGATTTGNVQILNGTVTAPTNTFAVAGSFINAGTFTHNSGTVLMNSTDTGEVITPGSSSFYNLTLQGTGGGWTITNHATTTNNFALTTGSAFTLTSGQIMVVNGTFSNAIGGAATTWSGGTLYLNSGTAYSINAKSVNDTYGILEVGANTDIRMWNSSASNIIVNATGSLYSQDHGAVDGDLYIWGEYLRTTGTDYWSYATDFDGTVLGGSSRQVDVFVATSSSLTFSGGALNVLGVNGATTTIQNNGDTATYAFTVSGGTLNANYYAIQDGDVSGLALSGTPTVTSLSYGEFVVGTNTGTALTVAGSVIDQNPALQIQYIGFSTSSVVATGTNARATGAPASYWWFRNHYGSFDGEAYDYDPTGNPGNIRWDDSAFAVTLTGTIYADRGAIATSLAQCDGSTPVVRAVVNGGASFTGTCDGSGAYTIPNVAFVGDPVVHVYLDAGGAARGAVVTKTLTGNVSGLNIYEDALIVRHEDTTPITIDDLAYYDSTDDADLFFAATSGAPDTLTLQSETELIVWGGDTFVPGGNVTLQSGGSGSQRDGSLVLQANATLTASGSESHAVGGGLSLASGHTFTAANSTFTFTATTTGKSIQSSSTVSFYNIDFNGSGGGWNILAGATTTIQNSFAVTAGTLGGTGDIEVQAGDITGSGTVTMTGGIVQLETGGSFGNSNEWTFATLIVGDGAASGITTKAGSGTTTVSTLLRLAASQTLNAGTAPIVFTGSATPFSAAGTFNIDTAPVRFRGTGATTVADEAYAQLYLEPSSGSPTYILQGGTLSATRVYVGNGQAVTVTANTNDPSVDVSGSFEIGSGATYVASNTGALEIGGSYVNAGTFTHSNGTVTFDSADTGEVITPGSSSFYSLVLNSGSGGWTVTGHTTTTNAFSLTAAGSFTLNSGNVFAVGGTFTNAVGGASTTWTGSTLYLNSATSYSMNTKTTGGDTYGTLMVGPNTDIRAWNSSGTVTSIASSGSFYSQDHGGVDGDLYVFGEYVRSAGSDYWSYATDFDGTSLSFGEYRGADVRIASSSSLTFSGGVLDIIGTSTATTTIANQGAGAYSLAVSGGTLTAQYYSVRNTDSAGLALSGTPTVSDISYGDYELSYPGGSQLTVAASVITQNPLKIFYRNSFATSTGITAGYNVTVTGTTASSWKFNLHYGNYDGEAYNNDPAGDPGYVRWDDSATAITISGNVYSDEGVTVSSLCDGSTQVVRLKIQGAQNLTASCASGTGYYEFTGVNFNPGDVLTVFLDTAGGRQAANVTVDPITTISDMHLYENRVIVRHEDTAPLTIADMAVYDSSDDADIPFTAVDAGSDTLTLPPERKLIVWTSKTFAPAGDVTLQSGGSGNAWDGTLELYGSASFTAASTQSHAVGGSLIVGSGATLTPASSTFTFTATTTGKTITTNGSLLYNLTFNGTGGNWAFGTASSTISNNFTITNGVVTLASGTTTIGGNFTNSGGTFMHNNGLAVLSATATGKTVQPNGSDFYNLELNGVGGAWTFSGASATTTNNFTLTAGSTTLPSSVLAVGGSFVNTGGSFNHNNSLLYLFATASGKLVVPGGSSLSGLYFNGVGGEWSMNTATTTVLRNFTIQNGSTTLPTQSLTLGGSFINAGTFTHNSGTVLMNSTDTGEVITPGSSSFYNLTLQGTGGGWTITNHATTTNNFALTTGSAFTLTSGQIMVVNGTFSNAIGGAATTWTGGTLYLNSGTAYSINAKSVNDTYGILEVGANTDIRMWNSSASNIIVNATGSLYSQDHGAVDGDLYIWGEYLRTTGTDYWSYATDFDGTALGGSSRQVDVFVATSSSLTFSGGALNVLGVNGATTTIQNNGDTATYAFTVSGGTLNMNYYALRDMNSSGLSLSGSPTVTSLSYGDFEVAVNSGSAITLASSTIDANASKQIDYVRFATSTGISPATNVTRSGTPVAAWNFNFHYGSIDGEVYDDDGVDTCGFVRWDDSSCLFVSQEHYRFRNDDGGEGAPDSEWYSVSWTKRKKVAIENTTATAYTNVPVKIVVDYDADMQTDFDDIRFTDQYGTTSRSYWIEDRVASASSTIWVNLPSLPASDSTYVYMYYGNNAATDAGDGDATLGFFDDFEDDNISEYSGNTTLFDVDTTYNNTGTYGLDAGTNVDQRTTNGIYRTGSLIAQGDTFRFFQYVDATQEDEPCAFFGVGGSGANYAVCLDQYPSEKVILAENVTSNDGSGSVLSSTTVTYSTGWYEVIVDWLTDNSITVTVYDENGTEFATTSATDSSRTSGGVGFGFWYQYGGWDTVMSYSYMSSAPTYVFGTEQDDGGATWLAAEDTAVSGIETGDDIRLRFSVHNTGAAIFGQLFRLQYAAKGVAASCEAVPSVTYNDVPTLSGGCGSSPACVVTSTNFSDGSQTTPLLTYPAAFTFSAGGMVESPSNQTGSTTVATNAATEVEYQFELTSFATEDAYCFRATDGGVELDNYTRVAEVALTFPPVWDVYSFNSDSDIALTEGATTTIMATGTVTDNNGYTDILFATSTFYRSAVGPLCSGDENNCYQINSASCTLSSCAGSSCQVQCSADIQFFADPTDIGTYAAQTWLAGLSVEDSTGLRSTVTADPVDITTVNALAVTSLIDYGSLEVGEDTGATTEQTVVTNTGNNNIDIELEGTDLTGTGSSIGVGEQKFATTTFTYGACSICTFLTGSATTVELDLPKPTSSTTPSTDDVYWGINVPTGTKAVSHIGTNTFWATSD